MIFNHAIKMFKSQDFNISLEPPSIVKQNKTKKTNKTPKSLCFLAILSFMHSFARSLIVFSQNSFTVCVRACAGSRMDLPVLYWCHLEGTFKGLHRPTGGQRCSEITGRLLYVGGDGLGEICAVVVGENPAFFMSCSGGLWAHAGPRLGCLVSG